MIKINFKPLLLQKKFIWYFLIYNYFSVLINI